MKKYSIIVSMILFFIFNQISTCIEYKFDLDSNWTYYYPSETIHPLRYQSVTFLDSIHGLACFNFINSSDIHARIIRTLDGGKTWDMVLDDISIFKIDSVTGKKIKIHRGLQIYDIAYIDTNFIIALMSDIFSPYIPYYAISKDNGSTWKFFYLKENTQYQDVCFYGRKTGLISHPGGQILITQDSAKTWNNLIIADSIVKYPYDMKLFSDSTVILYTKTYIDENNPILAQFYIRKTTDLGKTWISNKCPGDIYGQIEIDFLNENECWFGGYVFPKDSSQLYSTLRIYKTINGGKNWELQLDTISGNKDSFYPCRVKFFDNKNGFFTGSNNDLFITSDGGNNWVKQVKAAVDSKEYTPLHLIDASFVTKDIILALSEYGYIFRYERNTKMDIEETVWLDLDTVLLYPNPASNQITINIKSDIFSKINIEIYNLLGIKQFEFELNEDENSIPIDVSNLACGVYFVVINDGNQIRKGMFVRK